ncbi:response regulator [Candidatus Halobeggiatoa sp. HSG11]|nr:response regulator [Candidatus Halobeggiatoa sp. HSG11]
MLRDDINLKNSKVLMVDDTPANIDVLRKVLVNEGYELFFANNGERAIRIANLALPDLILLDVMMPGMNGFETCRNLKQNETTKDIPIIFLTAKNQPEDIKEGFEIGAVDYIYKPFRYEEVCIRIYNHLQTRILMKQMEAAKIAADVANKAKNVFLTNMSHELRTPLNGILGYTQLFQFDKSLNEEQQQGIEIIHQSGQYLLTLINDILELSRIETGRMELHSNDFDLSNLLDNVLGIFQIQALQKKLIFNYQKVGEFPYAVHGDEKRLRQIIINLVGNAVKFTNQGSVDVKIEYWNNKVRLQVKDTGIGIAADEINKIFLPFEQLGDVFYKPEGPGLGLSITKTLVEMMEGKLYVESTVEEGTIFSTIFELPAVLVQKKLLLCGYEGQPNTILVFDNDIAKLIVKLLQPLGFNVIEAVDKQDCIDKALQNNPDLVIMPMISEAISTIKTKLTKTVIIVTSVLENKTDSDYDDLLIKPFFDKELFAKLEKHLALTWKHKHPDNEVNNFLFPPTKQINELFILCKDGNINGIQKYVRQFEGNEDLKPFADKVQQLAKNMQIIKIRKLIEPYIVN